MGHAEPNPAILDRLPHRPPFRFLTAVTSLDAGRQGQATWAVRGDEPFLAGHFPGNPIIPGVLISEALAQLAGLVGLHVGAEGGEEGGGRLAHVDVRFDHPAVPPATIDLTAKHLRAMGALHQFEVSAAVESIVVARGTLILAQAPPQAQAAPGAQ